MAQEPFLADQEDDDSEDTAPVPKTFQSKSPRTFIPHATTPAPKPKGDTFGDSVLKIGKSLVSPLPEHKPVSLPSSDEVESAARTFEADKSEPIAKGNLSTSKDPYNVQLDGKNLLLPSKDDTGRDLSVREAIAQYRFDGKHMGEFATPEDATRHVRILNGEDATEKPKQPEVKSTDLPKIASSAPKTFQKAEDQRQSNPELDRIRGAASPDELSRITPIPGRTEKLLHFLNGYTPSELGHPEINDIKGPGLQEIPGVRHFTDKLANLVTGSEGTGRLLAGAVVKALGEIAATGTDPRTVGTGGPKPEKPAGFDSFSAEPIEPKLIGSGQTEEAAANAPARKLLGAGDTTPIDPEMSLRRARELPPDLAAPGEEATFNAARAENIAKPIEMSAYERARAATGGKELPDELARPRSTPEESARVLGDEVPATTPKSFVPHQAPTEAELARPETQPVAEAPAVATKTPFKSPFEPKAPTQESLATTEKPTEAAAPEGKIGPYSNHTPEQLVKLVATGEKPSAILENLSPSQLSQMIKSATAMGLHVEKNPIVPNEPIISKSPSVAKRLAASIDAGDHATTGKLLGYSDADIAKFQEQFGKSELPKSFNPSNDINFARSEKGGIKIGQNIKRAAKELTTGYSQPLEAIMVREGMQNAIDAVRHQEGSGKIHTEIHQDGFSISDSGKGMNEQQLETVFSDLHESGKTSETGASGGKGVGKASYMLGGKHFTVTTVYKEPGTGVFGTNFGGGKKIQLTASGTPEEFSEHVPVERKEVSSDTPTGTKIETKFDEGQDRYTAGSMLSSIQKYSRGIQSSLTAKRYGVHAPEPFHTGEGDKTIADEDILGNDVKLIVSKDEDLKPRSYLYVRVLNNGMYQFSKMIYLNEETDHMPDSVIADIHPNAEEGTKEYPFPTSRDSLKDNVDIKLKDLVEDRLIKPLQQGKKHKLAEIYAAMTPIEGIDRPARDIVLFDPGNRLTKNELKIFENSPVIKEFLSQMDYIIDDIIKEVDDKAWAERLERVGLVLDPRMHGVHIPNPTTGKSAILINPFVRMEYEHSPANIGLENVITALHEVAHIGDQTPSGFGDVSGDDLADPRIGRYLQSFLQQTMQHGGIDPGHGLGFIKRLGQIYSNYGPKRTFEGADAIEKIIGNESGGYNPEAQKLLQIYTESRRREPTTEDLLSGTGTKQKPTGRSKDGSSGDDKANANGSPSKSAVSRLLSALEEAKSLNEEQRGINFKERSKRFAAFAGVKEGGQAGAAKSLGKLRGEFEKVQPGNPLGDRMGQKDIDTLFNAVKQANITPGEKARGYSALFKLINGERVPPRNELDILDQVFGNGFSDKIIEMHGGLGVVGLKIGKTANTMKALRSSLDLSAPLRQGIGLIHRAEYREAFKEMFKYFANPTYFKQAMEDMEKDPMYLLAKQAGLFIADPGSLIRGEEAFMNNYLHNIPKWTGVPMATDASERAYVGFLNKLRFDTFKSLINTARVGGAEPFTVEQDEEGGKHLQPSKVTENIAKYINISTGRGNLPGFLGKIAPELNTVIWSPRLISSRLTVLNPKYYTSMDPFTRKEAIKTLLAIAAAGITIGGLAYLRGKMDSGAKVGTDPLSADFGKVRYPSGNVVDQWAGFQQPIVAASRFIANSNNVKPQSRTVTLENYTANKLSPMAALAYEVASAQSWDKNTPGQFKNRYGQKKQLGTEVLNNFVPMFTQDLYDIVKSDPSFSEAVGLGTASILGVGIQNYPESRKKPIRAFGLQRLKP